MTFNNKEGIVNKEMFIFYLEVIFIIIGTIFYTRAVIFRANKNNFKSKGNCEPYRTYNLKYKKNRTIAIIFSVMLIIAYALGK